MEICVNLFSASFRSAGMLLHIQLEYVHMKWRHYKIVYDQNATYDG